MITIYNIAIYIQNHLTDLDSNFIHDMKTIRIECVSSSKIFISVVGENDYLCQRDYTFFTISEYELFIRKEKLRRLNI